MPCISCFIIEHNGWKRTSVEISREEVGGKSTKVDGIIGSVLIINQTKNRKHPSWNTKNRWAYRSNEISPTVYSSNDSGSPTSRAIARSAAGPRGARLILLCFYNIWLPPLANKTCTIGPAIRCASRSKNPDRPTTNWASISTTGKRWTKAAHLTTPKDFQASTCQ